MAVINGRCGGVTAPPPKKKALSANLMLYAVLDGKLYCSVILPI